MTTNNQMPQHNETQSGMSSSSEAPLNQPLYGASFPQAIKRFFKKYARFSGYASRSEFWWATLFLVLLSFIPSILLSIGAAASPVAPYEETSATSNVFLILGGLAFLLLWAFTIIPSLAVTWRRLHDAGYSGAFYFISLIPWLGSLILFILLVMPSKPNSRRSEWNDQR